MAGTTFSAPMLLCAVSIGGCAAIERGRVMEIEATLEAAGFEKKIPQTEAQHTHLLALTPLRLREDRHDNDRRDYIYADPTYCQCLYAGDLSAYRRYQGLLSKEPTEKRNQADADMNWTMWGPWGWAHPGAQQ